MCSKRLLSSVALGINKLLFFRMKCNTYGFHRIICNVISYLKLETYALHLTFVIDLIHLVHGRLQKFFVGVANPKNAPHEDKKAPHIEKKVAERPPHKEKLAPKYFFYCYKVTTFRAHLTILKHQNSQSISLLKLLSKGTWSIYIVDGLYKKNPWFSFKIIFSNIRYLNS